jgi:lipoyl(octanoyl) transferase
VSYTVHFDLEDTVWGIDFRLCRRQCRVGGVWEYTLFVQGFVTRDLGLMPYRAAYQLQRETHSAVADGVLPPTLLFLEHPRVVTHGRKDGEDTNLVVPKALLEAQGIEVIQTERGGTVTYHGPGQLVAYAIFPVGRRVRDFLRRLENVQIRTLETYGLMARPNPGYAGVYVGNDKIGSIGVAVQRNVALHGLALNVNTNLADFDLIVPCGLTDTRMTSLERILGRSVPMQDVKQRLEDAFRQEFDDYNWLEELRGLEPARELEPVREMVGKPVGDA